MNISERLALLIKDRRAGFIFISAIVIVALSFYRAFVAGTLRVDHHGLSGIPVILVFSAYVLFLALYSVYYFKLWAAGDMDLDTVRILALALTAVFSFMLPMLSNDLYSLLTYGDAANRGVDVYTDTSSLVVSPFYDHVSYLWKTAPCVYGPVSLGTSQLACMAGGGNLWFTIAAYKVLAFVWAFIFIQMAYRIALLLRLSVRPFLFIVLNPIFLLQGVGQLHCDMLAGALCMGMLYFLLSDRWYMAFVFAGGAVAAKMNFVLVIGFLVLYLFLNKESWMSLLYKLAGGMCIMILSLFIFYYPHYTSPDTFRVPLHFLFSQNPAKSIPEVLGDVVYFAPGILTGHSDELHATLHTSSGLFEGQLAAWLMIKKACQLFSILVSAVIFIRFWMGGRRSDQWMTVYLRFLLLFLLFYSHIFYAWYLMMLLPFVWYESDKRFMQWLFVITCFSNVHDIICAIDKGHTPVYFVVLPLTFLSVAVFVWRFRNNFFSSLGRHDSGADSAMV